MRGNRFAESLSLRIDQQINLTHTYGDLSDLHVKLVITLTRPMYLVIRELRVCIEPLNESKPTLISALTGRSLPRLRHTYWLPVKNQHRSVDAAVMRIRKWRLWLVCR